MNILIYENANLEKIKKFFNLSNKKINFIKSNIFLKNTKPIDINAIFLSDLNLNDKDEDYKYFKFICNTYNKYKNIPIIAINESAFSLAKINNLTVYKNINNHNKPHTIFFKNLPDSLKIFINKYFPYQDFLKSEFLIPSDHNKVININSNCESLAFSSYFLSTNYEYYFSEKLTQDELKYNNFLENEIVYDIKFNNLYFSFDITDDIIIKNEFLNQILIKIIEDKI